MAETEKDWVKHVTNAYNRERKKAADEQRQKDAEDEKRLAEAVLRFLGIAVPRGGSRITVKSGEHSLTFGLERPGAIGTAVFHVCHVCEQEIRFSVTTAADVGRLIVEDFPHDGCKPVNQATSRDRTL